MASVASLVRSAGGYMSFIDYNKSYKDDNKEFLRGDMWEFSMINPPAVVYYPGDQLFKSRLNSVQLGIDTSVNGFEKRMRGNFSIYQQTGQITSGSISLQFTDREDQAISFFVDDWKNKICDRETRYSFRKNDLVCDCEMVLTNSNRVPVRRLIMYNCIIQDGGLDENGQAEDGTDRAEVPVTLKFEHYERKWENLA